jgi:aminoglycoside/choline kinase family phosphotransferase
MNERIPNFWGSYDNYQKHYLTADFSTRRYFRWQNGKNSFVLMDCPDLVSLKSFMEIGQYLRNQNLSAPEIIESDTENGFLLLEDFGDETFTKVLQNTPGREAQIYGAAVDILVYLQERTQDHAPFLKVYDVNFGLNKVGQFLTYYYPKIIGENATSTIEIDFINVWKAALEIGLNSKKTIFLRDYHVDNLMDLPHRKPFKNIGLLDFQDAIWAPVAGDLVSLLHDARREVSNDLRKILWLKYLDAHPKGDHQEIFIAGTILSAVRQARIIGLFTKKANDGKNAHFLKQIPHLWNLLEKCCQITELKQVWNWFEQNMPKAKRVIPNL